MPVLIDRGWLNVSQGSDSMKIYFESCKVDTKSEPTFNHYPFQNHLFYTTQKAWEVFKFKKLLFTDHAEFKLFVATIWTWQYRSTGTFTLRVERNDSGDGIEWDGLNEDFTVAIAKGGLRQKRKIAPADGGPYEIGMLILEQAG